MELNLSRWSGDNGRQKCKRLFWSGKKKSKNNKTKQKEKTKAGLLTWQRGQKEDEKEIALMSISQSFSLSPAPNHEF